MTRGAAGMAHKPPHAEQREDSACGHRRKPPLKVGSQRLTLRPDSGSSTGSPPYRDASASSLATRKRYVTIACVMTATGIGLGIGLAQAGLRACLRTQITRSIGLLLLLASLSGKADIAVSRVTPSPGVLDVSILPCNCRVFPTGEASPDVDSQQLRQLKQRSCIWDAESKAIRLAAARRETVSFQVLVTRTAPETPEIEISGSGLQGPSDAIPEANIRLFLAGYVEEGGKFYPDILVPFSAGGVTPFTIPHRMERLAPVPGQDNQTIWVDVSIPASTPPGLYRGTVTVTATTGTLKATQSFPIELTVLDLTLPLTRSVKVVLDDYSGIAKGLDLDSTPDTMLDLERRFYRLAHDHRMFVNVILYPQSGRPYEDRVPAFARTAKGDLAADWTFFDKRFGPYLDGTAFDDGEPIEQFCLYFNAYWPAMMWPKADHPNPDCASAEKTEYERLWREYAEAHIQHFKEKKWDKVAFTIKMNHYIKRNMSYPLLWNIDTPRTTEDFHAAAYFADLTHRAFAGIKPLTLFYRMDSAHSFCREASCPDTAWESNRADEIMRNVDLWFFEWDHGVSHLSKLREMKARSKQVYLYKHGWTCAERSATFSGLGWILWATGVDGYNAWNHPCAKDEYLLKKHRQDGDWDNYTMYPGWSGDKRDAFPSIRLKLQRNSLFDYEYIKQAVARDPDRTEATAARLVKFVPLPPDAKGRRFSGPALAPDPLIYAAARRELIAILTGSLPPRYE